MPVANCGANRVIVAAPVKVSAPSAPIMKPSNDSRSVGRSSRTITAGIEHQDHAADRDAEPVSQHAAAAMPAPSGTP